jgi:hypothetical protein
MGNDKEVLPDFEPRAEKRIRGTLPALLRPPNIFHRTGVFLGITGTPPKDWKAIYNCDDIIVGSHAVDQRSKSLGAMMWRILIWIGNLGL